MEKLNKKTVSRPSLLLVKDDCGVADALCQLLELNGYDVTHVPSLALARRALAEEMPSAIVLDVDVPDGCGLTFCRELRNRSVRIPVVICSGRVNGDAMMLTADADGFVLKPEGIRHLAQCVRNALERNGFC